MTDDQHAVFRAAVHIIRDPYFQAACEKLRRAGLLQEDEEPYEHAVMKKAVKMANQILDETKRQVTDEISEEAGSD